MQVFFTLQKNHKRYPTQRMNDVMSLHMSLKGETNPSQIHHDAQLLNQHNERSSTPLNELTHHTLSRVTRHVTALSVNLSERPSLSLLALL